MKYIIFKDSVTGLVQPVIFGEHTVHSSIRLERAKPVSAGFFSFENGVPKIYGESESLKLKPGETDLEYLIKLFRDMGTVYFLAQFD